MTPREEKGKLGSIMGNGNGSPNNEGFLTGLTSAATAARKRFEPVISSAKKGLEKIPSKKELGELPKKALEATGRVLTNSANRALLNAGTTLELINDKPFSILAAGGLLAVTSVISLALAVAPGLIPPESLPYVQGALVTANTLIGIKATDRLILPLSERFLQLRKQSPLNPTHE